ncbi:MAG: DUF2442 domain-containing protein [Rhodothermales bacterium]
MAEPRTPSDSAASPLPMLPRIVKVEAETGTHNIVATFASGEKRRYDVTPLLGKGNFQRIQNEDAFAAVNVDEMGGIVWDAGPDLSRDTVYLVGEPA